MAVSDRTWQREPDRLQWSHSYPLCLAYWKWAHCPEQNIGKMMIVCCVRVRVRVCVCVCVRVRVCVCVCVFHFSAKISFCFPAIAHVALRRCHLSLLWIVVGCLKTLTSDVYWSLCSTWYSPKYHNYTNYWMDCIKKKMLYRYNCCFKVCTFSSSNNIMQKCKLTNCLYIKYWQNEWYPF